LFNRFRIVWPVRHQRRVTRLLEEVRPVGPAARQKPEAVYEDDRSGAGGVCRLDLPALPLRNGRHAELLSVAVEGHRTLANRRRGHAQGEIRQDAAARTARSCASTSILVGGTAPVRVQVTADAVTAYVTARRNTSSPISRSAPGPSACSSPSAAIRAAPKVSPAPTVSATGTGIAGTSTAATRDRATAPSAPRGRATSRGPKPRINSGTSAKGTSG